MQTVSNILSLVIISGSCIQQSHFINILKYASIFVFLNTLCKIFPAEQHIRFNLLILRY